MNKLAILMSGFLDSPDYFHMTFFSSKLHELGYATIIIDPCNLWHTDADINQYSITNYLKQVSQTISENANSYDEVILVGHSMGGFTAIVIGEISSKVSRVVAICPPAEINNKKNSWKENGFRFSKRDLPNDPKAFREFQVPIAFVEDARQYSAVRSAERIQIPLLVIICEDDTTVDPADTEQIAIKGKANIQLVRIPGLNHSYRESEAETLLVWNQIKNYLF